jgi:hypothetical protein
MISANGKVGILANWEWNNQPVGKTNRGADQLAFMAKVEHDYYQDLHDHYRKIGCKQLINGSNWITSDAVRLNDLERWTNTPDEVMAVNRYFTGKHDGDNNGWRIDPGHVIADDTALKNVRATAHQHQAGGRQALHDHRIDLGAAQPVPERGAVPDGRLPVPHRGRLLLLVRADLAGVRREVLPALAQHPGPASDVQMELLDPGDRRAPSRPPLWRSASAYIKQGKPVVIEQRTLESMAQREYPLIGEDSGFDPNRQEGGEAQRNAAKRVDVTKGVDPLAFLVGPVEVIYGGDPAKSKVEDLAPYVHADKKTVSSNTGEIALDYGVGVCTINAPKIKGACGFLKTPVAPRSSMV